MSIRDLENQLNDFSLQRRQVALYELISMVQRDEIPRPPEVEAVNMHCHTFFSFNAYGYSPTGLAWLAFRRGFKAIGIVDFDVLDAVDEFLEACQLLGVRGSAGMETRVYVPEFSNRELNSPGEPGVAYYMGIGFSHREAPAQVGSILEDMRRRAERRNRDMLARLNDYLAPLCVDYDRAVLPLTPAGNATERHMLTAITRAAEEQLPDPAAFWALKLGMEKEQISALMGDEARFYNLVRARLMKRGGVGYVQPGAETFPTVEEVNRLIVACGALPCYAWLDGTSAGEQSIEELLGLMIDKGVAALNIIPDRNWNIFDRETRQVKVRKLYEVVRLAQELNLPINVGTEMNSPGQKLVDDFDALELGPVRAAFIDGAFFIYGHTLAQRCAGMGYQSEWARTCLPDRRERNAFYTRLGRQLHPDMANDMLSRISPQMSPKDVLAVVNG